MYVKEDLFINNFNIYCISVSVVEFRTEELMKKAVEKVNKHNLNGRPLKVKEVGHSKKKKRAAKRPKCHLRISFHHSFMLLVRTLMV